MVLSKITGSYTLKKMGDTRRRVCVLVLAGEVKISEHGYDELVVDGIFIREIIEGVQDAPLIEEYPSFEKGPCVLVRQIGGHGNAIHAVWGIPRMRFLQPFWSPHIDRIRSVGLTIIPGG